MQPVDRRDVRVVQRRQQLGLAFETLQPLGVVGQLGRQDLDRHLALEGRVEGLPDHAHPPLADLLDEAVVFQHLTCLDPQSAPPTGRV